MGERRKGVISCLLNKGFTFSCCTGSTDDVAGPPWREKQVPEDRAARSSRQGRQEQAPVPRTRCQG